MHQDRKLPSTSPRRAPAGEGSQACFRGGNGVGAAGTAQVFPLQTLGLSLGGSSTWCVSRRARGRE